MVVLLKKINSTKEENEKAKANPYTIEETIELMKKGEPLYEFFEENDYVKPYFDWDVDCETEEDMIERKRYVRDDVNEDLQKLGFKYDDYDNIAVAERH